MKLSKGKFQTILILAIVLAAYLLLAFVIPFTKTAVFWLALVFTLAAFGLQLYVLKLSFTKGKDARSKFYGFPIARIGVMYLIVQIALSFLFMAIAKFCAAWIAVIVLHCCWLSPPLASLPRMQCATRSSGRTRSSRPMWLPCVRCNPVRPRWFLAVRMQS